MRVNEAESTGASPMERRFKWEHASIQILSNSHSHLPSTQKSLSQWDYSESKSDNSKKHLYPRKRHFVRLILIFALAVGVTGLGCFAFEEQQLDDAFVGVDPTVGVRGVGNF